MREEELRMPLKTRNKLLIYISSLLFVAVVYALFDIVQYHTLYNWAFLFIYAIGFVICAMKTQSILKAGVYEPSKKGYKDSIKKRLGNSIYLTVYLLAMLIISLYQAIISSSGKFDDVFTAIRPSFSWLLTSLFILCAASVLLKAICGRDEIKNCKKYYLKQGLLSAAFWLLYLAVVFIIGTQSIYRSFAAVNCIYFCAILIYNFTVRKSIVENNFVWKKKYTISIISVILIITVISYLRRDTFYLQGYINTLPRLQQNTVSIEYREDDGVYELYMDDDEFKILQLTDIHLGGSIYSMRKDRKALEAVYKVIEYTRPDFVVVTGDMTFPMGIMSMSLNNGAPVSQFAAFMRNLNVPWAFTFGNHDTEIISTYNEEGLCGILESLSFKVSGTLLYPYKQPDITGRNNQVIEIYNKDGSFNQALFLIDSNAYTGEAINDYDYIHEDQVEWYEEEVKALSDKVGTTISSLAFFHIPLQQYRDAYELYLDGSDDIKYFFGSNDEQTKEKVCCSNHSSSLFDKIVELGSTKALFCGHDHYNNMSLEYQGIRLTYGMSIDYLVMPGIDESEKQRGGTVITIHDDSSFEIKQISLSSITKSDNYN